MEREASPYRPLEAALEGLRRISEHAERKHREHGRRRSDPRPAIPDPTITAAAESLADEAWDEISKRRMAGEPWHQARETVLNQNVRHWQKRYGKATSQGAFGDVMSRHPKGDAPDWLLEFERGEAARRLIEGRAAAGRPIRGFNLWWMRVFGIPLW